jgi:hypothetical protein
LRGSALWDSRVAWSILERLGRLDRGSNPRYPINYFLKHFSYLSHVPFSCPRFSYFVSGPLTVNFIETLVWLYKFDSVRSLNFSSKINWQYPKALSNYQWNVDFLASQPLIKKWVEIFCSILALLPFDFFDSIYILSNIHAICQILYRKFDQKLGKKLSRERELSVKLNRKKLAKICWPNVTTYSYEFENNIST